MNPATIDPQPLPRISVCMPAYEAQAHIGTALENLRDQQFKNWELIVVDDGSLQPVEAAVQAFAASVAQAVRYERLPHNRGPSAARNRALDIARGQFIAYLDTDDLWTPDHLERLLDRQAHDDADLVYAGCQLVDRLLPDESRLRCPTAEELGRFPLSLYERRLIIQPSSTLLRTSALRALGGWDESLRQAEDLELWIRAARAGWRFAFSASVSCVYQRLATGASRRDADNARALVRVYERHADWGLIPAALQRRQMLSVLESAGRLLWRQDPRSAAGYFRRALQLKPSLKLLARLLAAEMRALAPSRAAVAR